MLAALVAAQAEDSTPANAKKKQVKKTHAKAEEPPERPFIYRNTYETGASAPNRTPVRTPAQFNPDPGNWDKPVHETPVDVQTHSPLAPKPRVINDEQLLPVPGAASEAAASDNFEMLTDPTTAPATTGAPVPFGLQLPRGHVHGRTVIDERWETPAYPVGRESLGAPVNSTAVPNRWKISFPTWQRYEDVSIETPYQYARPRILKPKKPEATPTFLPTPLFDPYKFSKLKGDVPILGNDLFLSFTLKDFALFEYRDLPVGSGVSAAQPGSSEVFGRGDQFVFNNDASFLINIFKGETAFKPVNWAITFLGVFNENDIWVRENNLLNPDPRGPNYPEPSGAAARPDYSKIQSFPAGSGVNPQGGLVNGGLPAFNKTVNPGDVFNYLAGQLAPLGGAQPLRKVNPLTNKVDTTAAAPHSKQQTNDFEGTRYTHRSRNSFAVQEAFIEIHLSDLSNNYDFISSRTGIQPFNSDFRGFIFSDTNLGFRVFGDLDNNRVQYNLALFDMLEKDTYSDLNTLNSRNQKVFITNVYRQDFLWHGYTTQFSFHANFDDGGVHYDRNGFLTRPLPLGTVRTTGNNASGPLEGNDIQSYYLGWTGDGHIGRFNINHAFYQVYGRESYNQIAGHAVNINAQMAALELSYDCDWLRFKLSGFYASGDKNPTDNTARGFDSIDDNPFFFGGPFSWYTHEGFNLAGTSVGLKTGDSLVPNLRTAKYEGQSNFVNPGAYILGAGIEADITPKLRGFFNVNYIWFAQTQPLQLLTFSNKVSDQLGLDVSLGFKYRPLLTNNVVISSGIGMLFPGSGFESIYRRNTFLVPGYGPQTNPGRTDSFYYNWFTTVTLTY